MANYPMAEQSSGGRKRGPSMTPQQFVEMARADVEAAEGMGASLAVNGQGPYGPGSLMFSIET